MGKSAVLGRRYRDRVLPVVAVERGNVVAISSVGPPEAAVSEHGSSVGALSVDAAAVVRVSTHGPTGATRR
jgi:hypothetical protein